MIMWKTYLHNKIIEEKDIVTKLLEIDDNLNIDILLQLINKDIDITDNYETYLIESDPFILINAIDRLSGKNKKIIVCSMDNYSINTYILNKYKEYIDDNILDIKIEKHFSIKDNNILSIGSNAFNNEMKSIYRNIKTIDFEI